MGKIMAVVGPKQSGSTLLYNLLRFILEEIGESYQNTFLYHPRMPKQYLKTKKAQQTQNWIFKIHDFYKGLAKESEYIFLPMRDQRDCLSSNFKRYGRRKGWLNFYLKRNIRWFHQWKKHATYIFHYERYMENPKEVLTEICQHLKVDSNQINLDRVIQKSQNLHRNKKLPKGDNLNNPLYNLTLLSKAHNTSNGATGYYKTYLKPSELEQIERDFGKWFLDNGYPLIYNSNQSIEKPNEQIE